MRIVIGSEFKEAIVPLIDAAKKSIKIVIYDWRWYPRNPEMAAQMFNAAIARGAKRGLDVRAIVENGESITDLLKVGIKARKPYGNRIVHAKVMIIDDEIMVMGSHNYTMRGIGSNLEVSAVQELSPEESEKMRIFFENLWER